MYVRAETGSREVEVAPARPAKTRQEPTVTITLDKADADRLYNFAEYATRRLMNWRGGTELLSNLSNLTETPGRAELRQLAGVLGEATGRGKRGQRWRDE